MAVITEAPNRTYLYMTICKSGSAKGKNEEISMEALSFEEQAKILKLSELGAIKETYNEIKFLMESDKGIFKEKRNPVNNKVSSFIRYRSMDEWDETFSRYISMGAEVQETEKRIAKKIMKGNVDEEGKESYKPLDDPEVQEFIDFLRSYATQVLEEAFTISVKDVSEDRLTGAEDILKKLIAAVEDVEKGGTGISVPMFNDLRHKLHMKIPRAIVNVRKDDAKKKSDFAEKVKEELAFYEFFKEQVELARSQESIVINDKQTVLEAHNLELSLLKDEEELERIKCLMGANRSQLTRVFKARNIITEKYFNNYCRDHGNLTLENGGVHEFFHGSGTQNWWSIFSGGLYLNPEALGVKICGKAFGYGIYFANKAQKSIGYTSLSGSYWNHGNDDKAYLAIFEVATGEIYNFYEEGSVIPDNYEHLRKLHENADCLWAYSRERCSNSYLQNEEIIVFTDGSINKDSSIPEDKRYSQCTIKYILEIDRNKGTLY